MFFGIFAGMTLFLIAALYFIPQKTSVYRKRLVDLYVAGEIRKLAKKNDIDLEEEYKVFRSCYKKGVAEDRPLDHTIEMQMQEDLLDESDKKPKK